MELHPDFSSVAVGIREAEERLVAGIGVVEPSLRVTRAVNKETAPDVKCCSMEISMDLVDREKKDQAQLSRNQPLKI